MAWRLLAKTETIHEGARILEPSCGTGVKLDGRTAGIAKLLHNEQAEILNSSFEAFNLMDKAPFDYVIGNAPFGERGADTMRLDQSDEKNLDRYFVSRSIDSLKEGGVMALIVAPRRVGKRYQRAVPPGHAEESAVYRRPAPPRPQLPCTPISRRSRTFCCSANTLTTSDSGSRR
jgi:hypothetical protein